MTTPVLVRISSIRAAIMGAIPGTIATLGVWLLVKELIAEDFSGGIIAFALGIIVLFGGLATCYFGMALNKPVGLRMDRDGVSGLYIEPLQWEEIIKVGVVANGNNNSRIPIRYLGFSLKEPRAYFARKNLWGKINYLAHPKIGAFHVLVPEALLENRDLDALARAAQSLHVVNTL